MPPSPACLRAADEGYRLQVVLYMLQHRQLTQPEYLKAANAAGLAAAAFVDRKVGGWQGAGVGAWAWHGHCEGPVAPLTGGAA